MSGHHSRVISIIGFCFFVFCSSISGQQDFVDSVRAQAERGDAVAQYNLGVMYAEGRGVPLDDTEAVRWYRLAAEQGDIVAQANLGLMYAEGRGVPLDDAEAVRWYRLAAEQGDVVAQVNLAVMYVDGRGVSADNVLAHMWLDLALLQLTGESLQQTREARDVVGLRLTGTQLEEAQRLAREWESRGLPDR